MQAVNLLSVASKFAFAPTLKHTHPNMSRTRQPVSNLPQNTTESQGTPVPFPTTLRLRAEEAPPEAPEETAPSRRIRWSEDVVDNEGMGKKSSKGTVNLSHVILPI